MVKALRQRLDFIGPFDWTIMGILIGLFIGAVFGSRAAHAASAGVDWFSWWDGFLQNSGTEMLGAFLTFVLLELVRGSREKQVEEVNRNKERQQQEDAEERRAGELKELQQTVADELQKQIRSLIQWQEIARLQAAQTPEERQPILNSMRNTGLLKGAHLSNLNLKEASLWKANLAGAFLIVTQLEGADLSEANLIGATLSDTNLEGADLSGTNLERATLEAVNFKRANLYKANLQEANLIGANLEGANLYRANLEAAHLTEANLEGADFEGATLSDGTKLPGRPSIPFSSDPKPDWRTPFKAWDKAGRPRIEPAADEPESSEES